MPKVKTSRTKKRPEGFEEIEETLQEFTKKMKDAENDPHEGKRRVESLWPVFRIHHQRSRYVYDLYYKRKAISKELYEYCLKNGYADANLIAKWKKIITTSMNFHHISNPSLILPLILASRGHFLQNPSPALRSSAASAASNPKTRTLARLASAACPRRSWKRRRWSSASTAAAGAVRAAIKHSGSLRCVCLMNDKPSLHINPGPIFIENQINITDSMLRSVSYT
ncbi:G10 protein-domain-containing protein [Jimgerdemannia flammicorona]|uniref:G10 protein-domain-containing protein n=1 Tax=Jimgerdemannia flammicorona TaxID=994334 RepID=A0A433QPA5_9FUNG|nr:G10 protein-domain-containing protein [Jimgerdemannia flammicorona]